MKYWFSADMHLGHANIIEYCDRPFKDVYHMNDSLIKRWNEQVKPDDLVFHIGDFCFKNSPKMITKGEGEVFPAIYYEKQLNGKIIFFKGSHDDNNSCKTPILHMTIEHGGKKLFLIHDVMDVSDDFLFSCEKKESPDIILCGHVHKNWLINYRTDLFTKQKIPVVNVGIDVWGYRLTDLEHILKVVQNPGGIIDVGASL